MVMQKDARNPSKLQAEIHNIMSVEPFGIVYAAVLVRHFLLVFFLSQSSQTWQALSSTAWCLKDFHFDYKVFTEQLFVTFCFAYACLLSCDLTSHMFLCYLHHELSC